MTAWREFDAGPIRPPSEGGSHSLLLRFTRNCPWSRCDFCYAIPYRRAKFELRSTSEIIKDIDAAKEIADWIKGISMQLGLGEQINQAVAETLLQRQPEARSSHSVMMVFNWLRFGGTSVFLQDADTLLMKTDDLVEVITYLKRVFPTIQRITSYARAKTASRKSLRELASLKAAGLSRLHVGLETGDDELLKRIHKGVTSEEQIQAGKKIVRAGIELSEYIMPGLGGKEMSAQHASNTARVLNEIDPAYIRSRPLAPTPGTPLAQAYRKGEFIFLSPYELLQEMRELIRHLNVHSRLCFDHSLNPCWKSMIGLTPVFVMGYEGYQMPKSKEHLLSTIDRALKIGEERFLTTDERGRLSF